MQQQPYYPADADYDPAAGEPDTTVPGRGGQVPARAGHQPVLSRATWPTWATGCSSCWTAQEVQAFVLNTGRVGGGGDHPGSKKVTIPCSSAIVQGIVEGTIEWTEDPDFGYEVAVAIPGVDDIEILQPRRPYARQGRTDEHEAMVARLKRERKEFLGSFPGLDESMVKSLG
jgi:ATP-dependent phosphoenolpyruvate carboxykinase